MRKYEKDTFRSFQLLQSTFAFFTCFFLCCCFFFFFSFLFFWVSIHFRTFVEFVVYLLISPFSKFDGMETFLPFTLAITSRIPNRKRVLLQIAATARVELTDKFNKRTFRKRNCGIFFFFLCFIVFILKWKKEVYRKKEKKKTERLWLKGTYYTYRSFVVFCC